MARSRLLALVTLTAAVLLGAGALLETALASTTPTIGLSANAGSALYGSPSTVSLTASNPAGQPTGYNLTMEDVLPAGVSYVGGSSRFAGQDVEPQVLNNEPSSGETTLIWSNLSDLSPNSSATLTYQESASTTTFSVGDSYTEQQSAYINTSPRTVPSFTAGAPVSTSYTGSASASSTTTLSAIQVTTSDAAGSKLLRGVHDHQTVYTMTVTNNGIKQTTGTALDAYLPAGLEFLGCGDADNTTDAPTNPGSTEEWPGSGALSGQSANPAGSCASDTEVQTGSFAPGHGIPAGFYTHVSYNPGTLAAGQAVTYKFLAGIPIRENTDTWTGTKASDASKLQAANLDNNSGPETHDGESLPAYALATGSYNGTTAVADTSTDTVTAKDDTVTKSVSNGNIAIGDVDTWKLNIAVGEYRYVKNLQVTDTMPNGTCPAGGSGDGAPADCAAVSQSPSSPYKTIAENSDGSWTETWDQSTDSALAELGPNATTSISIPVLVRAHYQSNGSDTTPIVAGDSWSAPVSLQSADYVRCGQPDSPDCSAGGTKIDHDMADGTVITDSSSAGQSSDQPAISKLIDGRTVTPVNCATDSYVSTTPNYSTGDTVCYKLHIDFPAGVYTGGAAITDFLPPGSTYNASSWQTTASNTATVGTVDSTTNPGVLSIPLGSGGYVSPGRVLDGVYSVTITDPTAANQYDIKGNLMKFANVNTAGQSFPQRAAANYEFNKALLSVTEGIYKSNGNPSAGNAANTDHVQSYGGDTVTVRVDVTNNGGLDATNTQVWEDVPTQVACSGTSAISDSGACVSGTPNLIEWTGLTVPAGQTKTLYYTYTVPPGSYANQTFDSHAGVVEYDTPNDNGGEFVNIPASNIDPSITTFAGSPNTTAADDTTNSFLGTPTITASHTTSVTETANNTGSQATIGETINYTATVTLPAGTTQGILTQLGVELSGHETYVPGSVSATLNGGAVPSNWNAAEYKSGGIDTVWVSVASGYTSVSDDTVTLKWSATVNDDSTNVRTSTLSETPIFSYDAGASGTNAAAVASAQNTTIVEPNLTAAITSNASGRVTPGQAITYTAKLTDTNTTDVSSANNTTAVVTVPTGETPVDGSGNPVADGGTVGGGGNGVWSQSARTITFPSTSQILPGTSTSYAYTVTVDNPQTSSSSLTNTLAATATSLENAPTSPGTARTATTAASAGASGYSASASNTVQLVDATVATTVTTPAGISTSENGTVGDPLTYRLYVTIPAGVQLNDAMVRDIVPDGVAYDGLVSSTCTSGCGTPSDIPVSEIAHQANANGTTTLGFWLGQVPSSTATRTLLIVYAAHALDAYHTGSKLQAGQTLQNSATVDDNTAQQFASEPGSIPAAGSFTYNSSPAAAATVNVVEPNVSITKSYTASPVSHLPYVTLKDTVTYTLAVKNTGTDAAYDVPVTDTPSGQLVITGYTAGSGDVTQPWTAGSPSIAWSIPTIGAGQTVNLSYSAVLVDSSKIHNNETDKNTAAVGTYYGAPSTERAANPTFTYRTYTGSSAQASVTPQTPALTVNNQTGASGFPKTAHAQVGQPFTWRPTITNSSAVSQADNVVLTYQLPANWTYVPGSEQAGIGEPAITHTAGGDILTWNVGTVGASTATPYPFQATPSLAAETDPGSGPANLNSAKESITWSDDDGNTASADGPYAAGPDTASAQLDIPVLTVTETPKGGNWTAGAEGDWTIKVSNTGAAPATNVTVTDDIPAGDAYQQGAASASPSTGFSETHYDNSGPTTNVTWAISSLAAGASTTITVPTTPAASTPNGTVFSDTASARADEVPAPVSDSGSATVATSADMAVTDAATPSAATAGRNVTYTLTATDNGPSDAQGVTLTDTLDSSETFLDFASGGSPCTVSGQNITCNWATMPAGGSHQVVLDVALASNAPATVPNIANVTSPPTFDPNPANNTATASVTTQDVADLALTDTASSQSVLQGTDFTYTLTATNNGPSDAPGTTITDTLPVDVSFVSADAGCTNNSGTVTCAVGTLANGTSATYHIAVSADTPGSPTDTADVNSSGSTDTNPANNTASAQVTINPAVDLAVQNTGPANVTAGGQATYTLTATNHGPSDGTGVTVTDTLPTGETFVSAAPGQGSCQNSGQTVTCDLGPLASGQTATVSIVVTADYSAAEQTLTNTASIAGNETDPNPANNTASADTTVGPAADMAISETVDRQSTSQQRQATYTLTYANHGPSVAHDVTVTNTLPAGVSFNSADDPNCAASGQTVTCAEQTMAAGASGTIHITVTAAVVGTQHDTASVTADEPDPDTSNNTASGDLTVGPTANLTLTKTASAPTVAANGTITYTLTAVNHGPSDAHHMTVTDPLPAGLQPLDAAIDSGGSCQIAGQTVTCTLPELDNGAHATETLHARAGFALAGTTVINAATASADEDDTGRLSERTGTASVNVGPAADVSVTASAPASIPAGSNATFALQVANAGPQAATAATVTDTLPAGVTLVSAQPSQGSCSASGQAVSCQLGTIQAGAGTQVLLTVAVPAGARGSTLTDTARVSAQEPDPNAANNASQAASPVVAPLVTPGHLTTTITAKTPQVRFGGKVVYTIAVTNDSTTKATHVKQLIALNSPVKVISVSSDAGKCKSKNMTCALGTIRPGQTVYIHLVVRPQRLGAVPVSTVANSDQGASHRARAKALTTVKSAPTRLTVSKVARRSTLDADDPETYTLTVRNVGRHAAANVVVCDRANLQMTYVVTRGARFRHGQPCWTDRMLAAGHRFTVTLTVNFVDSAAGRQSSSAQASAKNARPARAKSTVGVIGEDAVNALEGVTG